MVVEARDNRTNPRAIQNAKAMYFCVAGSLVDQIKSMLFEQTENIPEEDGPTLLIKAIESSQALGTAASIKAMQKLSTFDPSSVGYDITKVNTAMFNLMTQAAATLGASYPNNIKVAYLIQTYGRILQPETWVRWVDGERAKVPPPDAQTLANNAVARAAVLEQEGHWKPSKMTQVQELQVMLANKNKRKTSPTKDDKDPKKKPSDKSKVKPDDEKGGGGEGKGKRPKFLKKSKDADGNPYKLGDTKEFNGTTYYFCDARHRFGLRWHTHKPEDCATRRFQKKPKNGTPEGDEVKANEAIVDDDDDVKEGPLARAMAYLANQYSEATSDSERNTISELMVAIRDE